MPTATSYVNQKIRRDVAEMRLKCGPAYVHCPVPQGTPRSIGGEARRNPQPERRGEGRERTKLRGVKLGRTPRSPRSSSARRSKRRGRGIARGDRPPLQHAPKHDFAAHHVRTRRRPQKIVAEARSEFPIETIFPRCIDPRARRPDRPPLRRTPHRSWRAARYPTQAARKPPSHTAELSAGGTGK